jgi:hypothetical protein
MDLVRRGATRTNQRRRQQRNRLTWTNAIRHLWLSFWMSSQCNEILVFFSKSFSSRFPGSRWNPPLTAENSEGILRATGVCGLLEIMPGSQPPDRPLPHNSKPSQDGIKGNMMRQCDEKAHRRSIDINVESLSIRPFRIWVLSILTYPWDSMAPIIKLRGNWSIRLFERSWQNDEFGRPFKPLNLHFTIWSRPFELAIILTQPQYIPQIIIEIHSANAARWIKDGTRRSHRSDEILNFWSSDRLEFEFWVY